MKPWYRVVVPRMEVREGRSFNPDEFAIALEQIVAGNAPEDYRDPARFFARTSFTRALTEHVSLVLRRLSGETANTAPVMALITQFGGGKTHTLATLYHLARGGNAALQWPGGTKLLTAAGLPAVPDIRVAVFVGNAWDSQPGRETPWIDLARQLAGDEGVAALGTSAQTKPPGTSSLAALFAAANQPVLILMDEVLNFANRYRDMAEPFYAFLQNLTVAMTGETHGAAVISLPRSQVEMTEWDLQWQERTTKIVRRVSKDLIVNDEAEIAEVVRRRLFEDASDEEKRERRRVAAAFADWCFQRRAQLPSEWTAVDTALTEAKAKEFLQNRFETCYPFHPATLSVFQRKWQALSQYQQTRGTLAMLAQWISWAYKDGFTQARTEPLITLGSAPLGAPEVRSIVLGQLGEMRLLSAIEADIAGQYAHARALDADTKGPLRGIHQRVATAILFESSGGQTAKVAHLPELRFALGEPEVDTTSVDSAALALENRAFYIRKVGTDGYQVRYQPTLKKVVSDRRASLDYDQEVKPAMRNLVQQEFDKGRTIPAVYFPEDSDIVTDSPRLTLAVMSPLVVWEEGLAARLAVWTKHKGNSPRLYPGALVWCVKKPGNELRQEVEEWLAWRRVKKDIDDGTLGGDLKPSELQEIRAAVAEKESDARAEVWASYRYMVIADQGEPDSLRAIDIGAGHASNGGTLCGRVIAALKSKALLNEAVGAGYIDRNWPPALQVSGAWPLSTLRQSFLNGSLTRLIDPDTVLRGKIVEFVGSGDFGLSYGPKPDGSYERVWFDEPLSPDEVAFEAGVFLLKKAKAEALMTPPPPPPPPPPEPEAEKGDGKVVPPPPPPPPPPATTQTICVAGTIPPESWNRLGTRLIPKLRAGQDLRITVEFKVEVGAEQARPVQLELFQVLEDLGLSGQLKAERS